LDKRIYIIQGHSESINVFKQTDDSYLCVEEIQNEHFNKLEDIVACYRMRILFILDQSGIWQLDKNGNISHCVEVSSVSATMSLSGKHLLVTSSETLRKYRYGFIWTSSPAEVRLPVGLSTMNWHALEVDDGKVIVAHAQTARFHQVSRVGQNQLNRTNADVLSYGREVGGSNDQLSSPVYLALEPKHGHIFVADRDNRRVVVLDCNFSRVLMILLSELPAGCHPNRLCYVEERSELIVGMSDGLVIGYKFRR